jgi:L-ascorbate metabolism protein UlaG (beta-lactamase superfamily)
MRMIRYTHSCVRLERDGRVLVIDPGIWSEPQALLGADAILVTHEHYDHIDRLRLAGLGVPVHAPSGANIRDLEIIGHIPGEEFNAAGFQIRAVGGRHALVYGRTPDCANLGYVVEDSLYHPGDSLHLPDQPIETLLVPIQASWLKTAEAIDFALAIAPERSFGIHDGQINERGLEAINHRLAAETGDVYSWLPPGGVAP